MKYHYNIETDDKPIGLLYKAIAISVTVGTAAGYQHNFINL